MNVEEIVKFGSAKCMMKRYYTQAQQVRNLTSWNILRCYNRVLLKYNILYLTVKYETITEMPIRMQENNQTCNLLLFTSAHPSCYDMPIPRLPKFPIILTKSITTNCGKPKWNFDVLKWIRFHGPWLSMTIKISRSLKEHGFGDLVLLTCMNFL